mmetsp:Transcript_30527/g.67093  ORF Transcript_30527/g.67093 Transcript_30527/m.67093 type:complete len:254 (-) Transcript_30527:1853-2614(-)
MTCFLIRPIRRLPSLRLLPVVSNSGGKPKGNRLGSSSSNLAIDPASMAALTSLLLMILVADPFLKVSNPALLLLLLPLSNLHHNLGRLNRIPPEQYHQQADLVLVPPYRLHLPPAHLNRRRHHHRTLHLKRQHSHDTSNQVGRQRLAGRLLRTQIEPCHPPWNMTMTTTTMRWELLVWSVCWTVMMLGVRTTSRMIPLLLSFLMLRGLMRSLIMQLCPHRRRRRIPLRLLQSELILAKKEALRQILVAWRIMQ